MRNNYCYSDDELKKYLQEFYTCFENGFEFEEFLKVYLERLGLCEVVVTQRTRDGGIDLTACRPSLGMFGTENYIVQAKRNKPSSTVSPEKIRALRGVMMAYTKGVFITTAKVSDRTKDDASKFDPSKPIIVIDGIELIKSCIQYGIGFSYKPIFSKSLLNLQISRQNHNHEPLSNYVEKTITENDIRARIISVPKHIISQIPNNVNKVKVSINENDTITLTLSRPRNYLGGVTNVFKQYSLIDENGTAIAKSAKWFYDVENEIILIYIN